MPAQCCCVASPSAFQVSKNYDREALRLLEASMYFNNPGR